ncbi:non-ribosomal peptide synthetase [Streptomyces sp. XD-27]|uniref:non-ribosomal peptide synthetase n=1 Tax=Streptomyces sp. XD-27 TaxID=3062779 RepID=UPI0026F45360|nr:non-ribosomal peptide synthetase [Streptomyces sp. XD-27]WKX69506.1 non-ribosomal peptide synthetase [Streptomyces sp. XD-27]
MSGVAIRDLGPSEPVGARTGLLRRLAEHAARTPDGIAVSGARARWSYREFERETARLADRLRHAGIGAGDTVAIHARRTPALALALVAVARSGAAFVVCDAAHPAGRLRLQAEQAAVRAWIACDPRGIPDGLADGLPVLLAAGAGTPASDGETSAGGVETAAARGETAARRGESAAAPLGGAAYVAFTSGTTGRPRGVIGDWEPVEHFIEWYVATYALDRTVRGAVLSGLGHDPLLRDVFVPLWTGGTVVFPEADVREARAVAQWLADERITLVHLTPGLGDALADSAPEGGWPSLHLAGFGGEPLTWRTVDAWTGHAPKARVLNLYGTTETPQAVSVYAAADPGRPAPARQGSRVPLGPGIDGVELMADGGELVVRTAYLARYADDTAPEGFGDSYRTGDLVRPLPGGAWEFAGRRDQQTKIRGHRVEPAETEAVLLAAPGVAQAVVTVSGEALVAHVVATPGRDVPADEARRFAADDVRRFAAERLPEYAVPARVVVHDALPLTPNGKVDRAALAAPQADTTGGRAPANPREEALCALFAEVLGVPRVGPDDDFFALGGHSLKANRLVNKVRRLLGAALPVGAVFDAPTPARLARGLDAATGGQTVLAPRPARSGSRCPAPSAGSGSSSNWTPTTPRTTSPSPSS